jgi:hypothetical protein
MSVWREIKQWFFRRQWLRVARARQEKFRENWGQFEKQGRRAPTLAERQRVSWFRRSSIYDRWIRDYEGKKH